MTATTLDTPVRQPPPKDRSGFLGVLRRHIVRGHLATSGDLLVIGASDEDAGILRAAGWSALTLSNFGGSGPAESRDGYLQLDAENLHLADGSFEAVAAYEVLHHCRSPHRALCEMLRVSRRFVLLQEPNESSLYALLRFCGVVQPFEIPAVVANGFVAGGVRNTAVPNFIYRWDARTIQQTVSSFLPERIVHVHAYPYWELNHTEFELSLRLHSRLGPWIRLAGGPRNFRRLLRVAERVLNLLPLTRKQGNQFFCCIEKTPQLRAWLQQDGERIVFNRDYLQG